MNNTKPSRSRTLLLAGVVLSLVLFFSWALLEPMVRSTVVGERILSFFTRPLLHIGDLPLSLAFLGKTALFLTLLGLFAGWLRVLIGTLLTRGMDLEPGQIYAIEKATGYAIFIFGCIVGVQSAGINLSSLAVVGGALGIGIGLGFQESANNFLSGIILLMERPIKVGDRVEVGGLDGDVVRIGIRATWVRTNASITVIVPNSEFVSRQVINWTAAERQVRFSTPVGVSYKSDPNEVRKALLNVAARDPDVLDAPAPDVLFTAFGDSSLNFELRVWTLTHVRTPHILRSKLYFAIFEEFGRRGIEIPYPQRDLHLRSSDAVLRIEPR